MYTVNERGERVVGEEGEIYVSSPDMKQYWNNPEENARKFMPDPEREGWMILKTGDLGIFLEDGNLLHLGRKDHRVIVRGFTVDLVAVENAITEHPAVKQAVVNAYQVASETQLAAYIVMQTDNTPFSVKTWRDYLGQTLPDYMIPTRYITLDMLPILASGKVDRRALPDPTTITHERSSDLIAPRNTLEQQLLDIWQTILKSTQAISVDDHFFELGGSSLQATALIIDVNEFFNVVLTPATLYQSPTIASLAQLIETGTVADGMHPALIPFRPYGQAIPIFVCRDCWGMALCLSI